MKVFFASLAMLLLTAAGARAADDEGDRFHFDVGLTYSSGVSKIDRALQDGYNAQFAAEGVTGSYDSFYIPVGLRFDPYYLFSFGLGIGGSIGPISIGDVQNTGGDYYVIVPVGLDLRYVFINDSHVLPYVRGGFRYPIIAGDLVSDAKIGGFGAVGIEYTPWHIGLEFGYDGSTVSAGFLNEKVRPNEFMVSLYAHF